MSAASDSSACQETPTPKPDMEDRGKLEKATGKVRKTYGDAKEHVKDEWQKP
jgi:uncharacterized protein YjbJ (UPF0337 family)